MHRLRRLPQRPEPPDETPRSWDVPVMLVVFVIGGILGVLLLIAFAFFVGLGVERFVEWLGPRVVRILMGLVGLVMFGAGSIALFRFLTGRAKNVAQYSKTRVVLSCLVFVLAGLFLLLAAVLASDSEGF